VVITLPGLQPFDTIIRRTWLALEFGIFHSVLEWLRSLGVIKLVLGEGPRAFRLEKNTGGRSRADHVQYCVRVAQRVLYLSQNRLAFDVQFVPERGLLSTSGSRRRHRSQTVSAIVS
jgi:hypothetical protein